MKSVMTPSALILYFLDLPNVELEVRIPKIPPPQTLTQIMRAI